MQAIRAMKLIQQYPTEFAKIDLYEAYPYPLNVLFTMTVFKDDWSQEVM